MARYSRRASPRRGRSVGRRSYTRSSGGYSRGRRVVSRTRRAGSSRRTSSLARTVRIEIVQPAANGVARPFMDGGTLMQPVAAPRKAQH